MKLHEFVQYLAQGHWNVISNCDLSEFTVMLDETSKHKRIMVINWNYAYLMDCDDGIIRTYDLAKCHLEPDALGIKTLIEEEE